jgi:triosephosphate isomerase
MKYMKHLIVANWKMNPSSQKEAKTLFDAIKKRAKSKNVEVVICPPFLYLPLLKGLPLGGQNIFWEEKGAFTGEISALQLKDLNVEYVLIGHSERRKYFHETNEIVNKKIKLALSVGLSIIFCVGENATEDKSAVLDQQITEGLKNVSREQLKNIVIAYEPVWAIGTGNSCSVDQTMGSILLIKKIISQLYTRELADTMKILYGGSVTSKNSAPYIKEAGCGGLLVGGASLNSKEFINIITSLK